MYSAALMTEARAKARAWLNEHPPDLTLLDCGVRGHYLFGICAGIPVTGRGMSKEDALKDLEGKVALMLLDLYVVTIKQVTLSAFHTDLDEPKE